MFRQHLSARLNGLSAATTSVLSITGTEPDDTQGRKAKPEHCRAWTEPLGCFGFLSILLQECVMFDPLSLSLITFFPACCLHWGKAEAVSIACSQGWSLLNPETAPDSSLG